MRLAFPNNFCNFISDYQYYIKELTLHNRIFTLVPHSSTLFTPQKTKQ